MSESLGSAVLDLSAEDTSLSAALSEAEGNVEASTGRMITSFQAVGAAMGLAGGGIEAMNRSQQGLTETVGRVAAMSGESTDAIRDQALALSNVTFPLEDVVSLMETGRQQGIESAEQLGEYATFWDKVGDATGLAGPQLGKAGVALRAVGVDAGNEAEALGAFGFITESTTGDVEQFLRFLDRTGPELRDMGANVDDAAAIMGILENELGMSARTARTEFATAVNEADGDLGQMLDNLGVSEEKFREYQGAVAESSGVIERNAEIHAESYTSMQRLGHWLDELKFKYAGVFQAVDMLAPVLIGLGAAFIALPPIIGAVGTAFTTLGTAIMANPIFLIAGVIIGIGVAVYIFRDDIMAALQAALDFMLGVWDTIWSTTQSIWGSIMDFLRAIPGEILGFFQSLPGELGNLATSAMQAFFDAHVAVFNTMLGWLGGLIGAILSAIGDLAGSLLNLGTSAMQAFYDAHVTVFGLMITWLGSIPGRILSAIGDLAGKLREFATTAITAFKDAHVAGIGLLLSWLRGLIGKITSAIGDLAGALWDIGWNAAKALFEGMLDVLSKPADWIGGAVSGVTSFVGGLKGPPDYDYEIGHNAASLVMRGLRDGFGELRQLERPLQSVTQFIQARVTNEPASVGAVPAMAGGGGPPVINVYGVSGRDVVEQLRDYLDLNPRPDDLF